MMLSDKLAVRLTKKNKAASFSCMKKMSQMPWSHTSKMSGKRFVMYWMSFYVRDLSHFFSFIYEKGFLLYILLSCFNTRAWIQNSFSCLHNENHQFERRKTTLEGETQAKTKGRAKVKFECLIIPPVIDAAEQDRRVTRNRIWHDERRSNDQNDVEEGNEQSKKWTTKIQCGGKDV